MKNEKPVDEIVVSTDRFRFHMGARFAAHWQVDADRSRAVLGAAVSALLEDEATTVPVLARQLGVTWPNEPLEYEVALREDGERGPCEPETGALPRRLELPRTGEPPQSFFACVLRRSFVRLERESVLYRALEAGANASSSDAGHDGPSAVYRCMVGFAIATLSVASDMPRNDARRIEAGLSDLCTAPQLTWVSREWVTRVREDESAEAFGARAARALLTVSVKAR